MTNSKANGVFGHGKAPEIDLVALLDLDLISELGDVIECPYIYQTEYCFECSKHNFKLGDNVPVPACVAYLANITKTYITACGTSIKPLQISDIILENQRRQACEDNS